MNTARNGHAGIQSRTSTKLERPVKVSDLAEFIATVPPSAELTVTTFQGGDQRDPYPVAYAFVAQWEGSDR